MYKTILVSVFLFIFTKVNTESFFQNVSRCRTNSLCVFDDEVCLFNDCYDELNEIVCENRNSIKHVSCSHQLGKGYATNDCLLNFHRNNEIKCLNRHIMPVGNTYNLGDVKLRAIYVEDEDTTVVNATFSNIKWKDLTFRFQEPKNKRSLCRSFNIKKHIQKELSLYYDCNWSSVISEGQQAYFEMKYSKDEDIVATKNYTFIIPKHECLDKRATLTELPVNICLFLYVDITDLNNLILHIQIPPENTLIKLNISDYDVYVYRISGINETLVDKRAYSNEDAFEGLITHEYNTRSVVGIYYFKVVPFSGADYGIDFKESYSPKIPISSSNILIGIVCGSGILAILFLIMLMYQKWIRNPAEDLPSKKQDILFVYTPTHKTHVNVVTKFAEMLKKSYKMNIMLDHTDIPEFPNKSPYNWMQQSFYEANYVVFFISPEQESSIKDHPYIKLFNLALRFTSEELSNDYSKKHYLVVLLPYSSQNIPIGLKNFSKYRLNKDFYRLMDKLQDNWFWQRDLYRKDIYKNLREIINQATIEILRTDNKDNIVNDLQFIVSENEAVVPLVDPPVEQKRNEYDDYCQSVELNMQKILKNKGNNKNESEEEDNDRPVDFQTLNLG